ncbi:lasso RiPP family leader peptide-containing protein [Streptomyces albofaciens JCM 4342]|nr:lasso RiPP family leader peptide-containing protein [Streptomyces albofaciens]KAA6220609.1 lasso RiPP family leader peptide-containing protein [Streptomyces albofaciens JCM 4342]KAA6220652.1 lasso RiPP family leader peptide-containing protein [Streptomyces albofaciens JCM 4342]
MPDIHEEIEYEKPELAEVGDFTELTRGFVGNSYDNFGGMFLNF